MKTALPIAGAMLFAVVATASAQDSPNLPATMQQKPVLAYQANVAANDPEAAENQPWMATGEDLKGPPRRFPAGQTPEQPLAI